MVKRLITAICLLTVVLGAIFGLRIFNLVFADMVAVLFGSVGVYELYNALKKARLNPMALPLIISAVIASLRVLPWRGRHNDCAVGRRHDGSSGIYV